MRSGPLEIGSRDDDTEPGPDDQAVGEMDEATADALPGGRKRRSSAPTVENKRPATGGHDGQVAGDPAAGTEPPQAGPTHLFFSLH